MSINEKTFEAFMLAYHENGGTGLGFRKCLEAYEAAKGPEPDASWLRFPLQKPEIGREYFIWLKPINGNGPPEWSIRKAVFDVTKWTDKGTGHHYEADVQSRITHFRPLFTPPLGFETGPEAKP